MALIAAQMSNPPMISNKAANTNMAMDWSMVIASHSKVEVDNVVVVFSASCRCALLSSIGYIFVFIETLLLMLLLLVDIVVDRLGARIK